MTHPGVSLASPGRQRPQAPGYAHRSVRFQEPQDFDPVAMDNRAGAETWDVLPMHQNWEAGLDATRAIDVPSVTRGLVLGPRYALKGLAVRCPEADAWLVSVLMIP